MTASDDALLDLIESCLERMEREGDAGLVAFCAEHPAQASLVRERVAMLAGAGLLEERGGLLAGGSGAGFAARGAGAAGLGPGADGSGSAHGFGRDRFPERLGEFRLLSRLGGGGMGVVYLAEQERLQRQVALKLIRPEHLYFPGARERFRREVEAVAKLQHPGIVPIYTVGEESGIPFFAMERVPGASLAQIIAAFAERNPATLTGRDLRAEVVRAARASTSPGASAAPDAGDATPPGAATPAPGNSPRAPATGAPAGGVRPGSGIRDSASGEAATRLFGGSWSMACLRIVRAVAEALAHAHERGVLHRDIKPSNIMLVPDGRVLLLDFGLALAEGSQRMTRSGSQLGSLAYMSPEQVRGEGLDARSDVYSLGVTLYELLTLRAPYIAETSDATSRLILDGRPAPPRELNPAVPRDAETVCLAAMERDSARRYADPVLLAEDLGRVLELRPIAARRTGALLAVRRWTQRHPAGATAVLLGGLLLVGGPAAYIVQQNRANARITRALASETRQREAAELAGAQAVAARELADSARRDAEDQRAEATRQAEEAGRQRTEAQRQGEAARAAQERAEANLERALAAVDTMLTRVGDQTLRDTPQGEAVRRTLLQDALRFYEGFLAENAGDASLALTTHRAADKLGTLHEQLGEWDAARESYERALAVAEEGLALRPDDSELASAVSSAHLGLHEVARLSGDAAEAQRQILLCAELRRANLARHPERVVAYQELAAVLGAQARLSESAGRLDEAEAQMREAIENQDFVATHVPDNLDAQHGGVQLRNNLAGVLAAQGKSAEAEAAFRDALDRLAALLVLRPDSLDYGYELGGGRTNLAGLLGKLGRVDEAEALLREALATLEPLMRAFPTNIFVRRGTAICCGQLATLFLRNQRLPEAEDSCRRGVDLLAALQQEAPDVLLHRADLSLALNNLGSILNARGSAADAVPVLRRGIELQRTVVAQSPDAVNERTVLRSLHLYLGRAQLLLGDPAACAATAHDLLAALPGNVDARRSAAKLLEESADAAAASAALPAAEREGLAQGYADEAATLRAAE